MFPLLSRLLADEYSLVAAINQPQAANRVVLAEAVDLLGRFAETLAAKPQPDAPADGPPPAADPDVEKLLQEIETALASLREALGSAAPDDGQGPSAPGVTAAAEADAYDQTAARLATRIDGTPTSNTPPALRRVNLAAMTAARPKSAAPSPAGGPRISATFKSFDGEALSSVNDVFETFRRAEGRIGRLQHDREFTVVSGRWKLPDERTLTATDVSGNTAKMDTVTGPETLVASGGICAPVAVDYSVPVFGSNARPLRDALPRFGADRGGIRYIQAPAITSVTGSVGIWTEATDASPGSATKAIATVTCASENTVYVDAITTRLKVGNMQGRFSPELVAAWTTQSLDFAARTAELSLWAKIHTASTAVTAAKLLGTTRDLLAQVDLVAAAYRYRQRIDRKTTLRAIFPEFAKDMIRADLARELAHDNSGSYNALAVSDAQIEQFFSVRNVSPIWVMDGLPAVTGSSGHGLQGWAAQSAGALADWPANVLWNLYVEGSFQFLDGGALDLGVVRDSTLNATNDYETFVETFEGLAFRGIEAIEVTSTVRPSGESAATFDTSSY